MKNKTKFAKELIITLLVASLLSSTLTLILSFIVLNLGQQPNSIGYIANIGATIWGLFVGYKINTLIRLYR